MEVAPKIRLELWRLSFTSIGLNFRDSNKMPTKTLFKIFGSFINSKSELVLGAKKDNFQFVGMLIYGPDMTQHQNKHTLKTPCLIPEKREAVKGKGL